MKPSAARSFALVCSLAACSSSESPSAVDASQDLAQADVAVDVAPDVPTDATAAMYTLTAFDDVRIQSNSMRPNFQRAVATVDLHDGPFERVMLVVDLRSTCFPFEMWETPPAGQAWPASCDAFDRNFEFTLDEPIMMTDPPAIELIRAITPFGGPEHIEQDITDVANARPGMHRLQVMIPTYSDGAGRVSGSDGGWNVTAHIEVTPGRAPRNVLAVVPLFNLTHMADTVAPEYAFEAPAGTTSGKIEYRITGHGGGPVERPACIGPAEEFCRRVHTLTVDGVALDPIDPWRTNCADNCTVTTGMTSTGLTLTYCRENPCGNMSSVRASRANWCPGTLTPSIDVTPDALGAPGRHTLRYEINHVATGGAQWRMSAVYFAYGAP